MFSFTKKGIKFRKYTPSELEIRPVSTDRVFLPVGEVYLEPGDRVQAGKVISTWKGRPVYAPCDGLFVGTEQVDLPEGKGEYGVIQANAAQNTALHYNSLSRPALEELIEAAGELDASDLCDRLRQLAGRTAVIRALDEGPDMATASGVICACLKEIVSCIGWLETISGQKAILYTNNSSTKIFVGDHAAELKVDTVSRRYPSARWFDEKCKKIDAVVFDVWEVRALFHRIAYGRPPQDTLVSRSVWGERLEICKAPVGAPVSALFEEIPAGYQFVLGGVLQGRRVDGQYPLRLQDSAVTLVPEWVEEAAVCIGCGRCVRACPVGLSPMLLSEQWAYRDEHTGRQYGADRCIGCNACSYICPSKLPLMQRIRAMAEVSEHE